MTADRTDTAPDVGLSEDERLGYGYEAEGIIVFTESAVLAILRTRLAAVEAAHARDLAALRERAEVAEAKVAAVADAEGLRLARHYREVQRPAGWCRCGHAPESHGMESDTPLCRDCGDNTHCDYADDEEIAADRWDEGWHAAVIALIPPSLGENDRLLWVLDRMPKGNPYRTDPALADRPAGGEGR